MVRQFGLQPGPAQLACGRHHPVSWAAGASDNDPLLSPALRAAAGKRRACGGLAAECGVRPCVGRERRGFCKTLTMRAGNLSAV